MEGRTRRIITQQAGYNASVLVVNTSPRGSKLRLQFFTITRILLSAKQILICKKCCEINCRNMKYYS